MVLKVCLHEWLSGGVSPCQGEGRGFESRLVLSMIQKRDIRWMSFFVCSSPAWLERFECLRSAAVVAGERPPDVLRRLVLSMIQKRDIRWVALFLYVQALPGSNGSNVCVPLRSSQTNVPRTSCNVSLYCFLQKTA